jgi:hypothetical protein
MRGKLEGDAFRHAVPIGCPMCGYKFDASSTISGDMRTPKPGDFTICARCTSLLMFGSADSLEVISMHAWSKLTADDRRELDRAVRAAESMERNRPDLTLDTVVTRGPGDFRVALTLKNGLFVVSSAFATHKRALKALRRARHDLVLLARFVELSAIDPLVSTQQAPPGWYGAAFVSLLGKEQCISPQYGPYPTKAVALEQVRAHLWRLNEELGVGGARELVLDDAAIKPGTSN